MNKQPNRTKSGLILPTDAEDAAINRGITADPDTVEITTQLAAKLLPLRRRGRPPVEQPKAPITTRIDADVLHAIKDSGKGWQTRLNDVLREAVQKGKFKPVG
ncbi:BrnA antitoxin family protein [Comamonas nitrativorans]|uniref:BrnA antitoxin family protein n=1 Tax=Comamonas nitrativorans TaxID=108437 RepID=A0ABV9GYE2_9BURK